MEFEPVDGRAERSDRRSDLLIWGASGHAFVVASIVRLLNEYRIVGFVDELEPERWGTEYLGEPVFGPHDTKLLLTRGAVHAVIAIGDCRARARLAAQAVAQGFTLATVVHPSAVVAQSARVGSGTVIMAGAVVNPGCVLGDNVIINTCASIDHECTIADGVHIGPGACLGGRVSVGRGAWIAIGATLVDRISIGPDSIVGAGAVVVRDVPPAVVVHGVPARVIRAVGEGVAQASD